MTDYERALAHAKLIDAFRDIDEVTDFEMLVMIHKLLHDESESVKRLTIAHVESASKRVSVCYALEYDDVDMMR